MPSISKRRIYLKCCEFLMLGEKRLGASTEFMELFIPKASLQLRRGSGKQGCASQNCTTLPRNVDLLIPEVFGMLEKGSG